MTKATVLLVLAFLVVCAAGVVVGTAVDRHVRPDLPVRESHDPIDSQLDLSTDQRHQMRQIWDDFGRQRGQLFQKRQQLGQQREEAFRALLTPDQKAQYDQIQKTYEQQKKAAEDDVQKAFREADEKTRAMLTADQQKKLDELRQRMPHGMGPPGMGPGMGPPGKGSPGFPHHEHHRSGTRPTTVPTSGPI